MFLRMSKVVPLVLAALMALPAMAGDRHSGHQFARHRGGFHASPTLLVGRHTGWQNRSLHFAGSDGSFGRHHRADRMRLLRHFSSPATGYARNNVIVIIPQAQGGDVGGTYAGSSYAYNADGGTYVGGDDYGFYPVQSADRLAPKAKVTDVAAQGNACSYEAGVCVIRP
jgi:hypothetical protein